MDSDLKTLIEQLCHDVKHEHDHEVLKHKYSILYEKYPKLYNMILKSNQEDEDVLAYMLTQYTDLYTNNRPKMEADMDVASYIADKYLYTDSTRPDQATLNECKNKLRRLNETR